MTTHSPALAPSGISCCGDLQWGAHFCHLYKTKDDLIDTLVPFFSAGLANNEQCLWITSEPLGAEEATAALAARVPDLQDYLERGQILIVDHSEWHTRGGAMDGDSLLDAWVEAEQAALAKGFNGVRATGNASFLKCPEQWREFEQYEARVTDTFAGRRLIGLCSYHLDMVSGSELLDVVRDHQFSLARRAGEWEMIESAGARIAKQALHKANRELEQRVTDRTAELEHALATVEAQKRELESVLEMRDDGQRLLEAELADARLIHDISAALIDEGVIHDLYQKLVDAAALIMRCESADIQRYHPERDELELLAYRGFSADAAAFWKWVRADAATSCAAAMKRLERVIASDVETCEFMAGSVDLEMFRVAGLRACQSTPLLTRNGALIGVISTHWKRRHVPSERDLRLLDIIARQAADLIERNVAAEAMRAQTTQLLDADRRKDEFLATLAHELRNPLAPIRTGLDVLRVGKAEQASRVLPMMERQLGHMVRLVDDLLDVSRVSRGLVTLQRERVELKAVVDSAIETSRPLMEAAVHRLEVTLPQQSVWLNVDLTRIAQVLSNVLNNAAKYTPQGGQVCLHAELAGSEVVIRITDTGIGIASGMLPKVFELFMQVDQAIERSQGGLGVGLSLAKRLVEMHGGSIEAASDGPRRGATFSIRLPVDDVQPAVQAADAGDNGAVASDGKRVMIVDDNVDAAETLALLLDEVGYATAVVFDARTALDTALRFRPEVVFLDLGMPHLNGFDLARQLRGQPALDDVVLVALSGWGTEQDRERCRDAGIDRHLTKPALPADILGILSDTRTGTASLPV
jgi:signal transduction histidine kinase/ActR/RegA family two-component response regulator